MKAFVAVSDFITNLFPVWTVIAALVGLFQVRLHLCPACYVGCGCTRVCMLAKKKQGCHTDVYDGVVFCGSSRVRSTSSV